METASQKLRREALAAECQQLTRRVLVPLELFGHFTTSDGEQYQRHHKTGVIRCAEPKVRGKAARRAEKRTRLATRNAA